MWLELLDGAKSVSVLLTVIAALTAVYVGYLTYKLNTENLKERLFDKRIKVYEDVHLGLSMILRDAEFTDASLNTLVNASQRARFLFGPEIHSFIKEIISQGSKMRMYQENLRDEPIGPKRSELVDKEHVHLKWLTDEIFSFSEKFDKYLLFGTR